MLLLPLNLRDIRVGATASARASTRSRNKIRERDYGSSDGTAGSCYCCRKMHDGTSHHWIFGATAKATGGELMKNPANRVSVFHGSSTYDSQVLDSARSCEQWLFWESLSGATTNLGKNTELYLFRSIIFADSWFESIKVRCALSFPP
jgi:hypothetical protein